MRTHKDATVAWKLNLFNQGCVKGPGSTPRALLCNSLYQLPFTPTRPTNIAETGKKNPQPSAWAGADKQTNQSASEENQSQLIFLRAFRSYDEENSRCDSGPQLIALMCQVNRD